MKRMGVWGMAAFLIMAAGARGASIYLQSPANNAFAEYSDFGFPQFVADDFSLAAGDNLAAVRWWGIYNNSSITASPAFSLRLYADTGSGPNQTAFVDVTLLDVTRTATLLVDPSGDTVYEFDGNLPALVPLAGSTTYWISPVDATADLFGWTASSSGTDYFRTADSGPWTNDADALNYSFELLNSPISVPVPASVWGGTALLALMGIAALRRKLARA